MPEPMPGQIAYDAFWQAFAAACGADIDAWDTIHPGTRQSWEAAAQAVLARHPAVSEDIVQQINAREAASLEALRREVDDV